MCRVTRIRVCSFESRTYARHVSRSLLMSRTRDEVGMHMRTSRDERTKISCIRAVLTWALICYFFFRNPLEKLLLNGLFLPLGVNEKKIHTFYIRCNNTLFYFIHSLIFYKYFLTQQNYILLYFLFFQFLSFLVEKKKKLERCKCQSFAVST